ncbi:MAG: 4Fe-4S dicluster domain-containing protein [Coriobacteriales bacterium]|jgi:formate dehydrogenase iron-sulfur subunit|nr:4Fe-4S dicluster domain-containing protein [Coriobacteriales bacterium]
MADFAIYFDASKCVGCKGCQAACKNWNLLPSPLERNANKPTGSYQSPLELNGDTRLLMRFEENDADQNDTGKKWGIEWSIGRRSCMHCIDPACAAVCPSGTLSVDDATGFVRVNEDACIGCHYCSGACPFDVPHYHSGGSKVNKCTACLDRIENGRGPILGEIGQFNIPACVHTCPPGALDYGTRSEMLDKAHERVEALKAKGYQKASVYGENELSGLHVIYVLKYDVETYGLPKNPKVGALVDAVGLMKPLTGLAAAATVAGLAVSFLTGLGYKRHELRYDETTHETIDVDTGEVLKADVAKSGKE